MIEIIFDNRSSTMTTIIPRRDYGADAERIHYTPAYRPVTNDWVIRHRSGQYFSRIRKAPLLASLDTASTFGTAAEAGAAAAALNFAATGESFEE